MGIPEDKKLEEEEVVRIILQYLEPRYPQAMKMLEEESKYLLEPLHIKRLKESILRGEWQISEDIIGKHLNNSSKLILLIKKQKYLEYLEERNMERALDVLRNEITPLKPSDLNEISSWIMCSSQNQLYKLAEYKGGKEYSRNLLLTKLCPNISSSLVIPSNRLETLLYQAATLQRQMCLYHNPLKEGITFSLLTDHVCSRSEFPCRSTHVLEEHVDEVWFVAFSHNGLFVASASKDATAIIWSVGDWNPLFTLKGHEGAVSFLAFSPDDSKLLTCSNDCSLRLWNVSNGSLIHVFNRHTEAVTACAWFPDNTQFVSSSLDRTIFHWKTDGSLLYRWQGARITDVAMFHDGSKMVAICHEKKIRVYDLAEKTEVCIQEENSVTSLCLTSDSKYAIVNISAEEIHLWDLEETKLVAKYYGQKQGRFVIRSCFGGIDESFIVSGSEDNNIYIWHRARQNLLEVLSGHTATVNSVCWNPLNQSMFVSGSDDFTVRVWGPQ